MSQSSRDIALVLLWIIVGMMMIVFGYGLAGPEELSAEVGHGMGMLGYILIGAVPLVLGLFAADWMDRPYWGSTTNGVVAVYYAIELSGIGESGWLPAEIHDAVLRLLFGFGIMSALMAIIHLPQVKAWFDARLPEQEVTE